MLFSYQCLQLLWYRISYTAECFMVSGATNPHACNSTSTLFNSVGLHNGNNISITFTHIRTINWNTVNKNKMIVKLEFKFWGRRPRPFRFMSHLFIKELTLLQNNWICCWKQTLPIRIILSNENRSRWFKNSVPK